MNKLINPRKRNIFFIIFIALFVVLPSVSNGMDFYHQESTKHSPQITSQKFKAISINSSPLQFPKGQDSTTQSIDSLSLDKDEIQFKDNNSSKVRKVKTKQKQKTNKKNTDSSEGNNPIKELSEKEKDYYLSRNIFLFFSIILVFFLIYIFR